MSNSAMMEMCKEVSRTTIHHNGDEKDLAPELTQNEIKMLLQKDQEKRIQQCGRDLNDLLQKYNCKLSIKQVWTDGIPDGKASIVILAND